ncbi:MAG: cob(I)yrinic acid a,c-diamide adenosyltransferase [Betaproteobacteria bacterium]|jgi:cob(I)alamin adenosyltransferase|nr:MAG: cob(I)yrinic acid a,c-diamide adenosyltransferase [Betaproteobacteria bacterium]
MGNRLSKIYTRTGDTGTTGLGDGSRVPKDNARIEAIGAVDELNSAIGVVLAEPVPDDVAAVLTRVQHELFDLGGELSIPGYTAIDEQHINQLEKTLDDFNAELPALKEFILPGGAPSAALAHVARATCRRAERRLVKLALAEQLSPLPQRYLNRLSDLLFVLCRVLNRSAGHSDVYWRRTRAHDA